MNKLLLFLASALLLSPLVALAADHSVREADLTAIKELDQAHMDTLKESTEKDLKVQAARLDAQDKRLDQQDKLLDSFSERIGDLSVFLTMFGVVAGLVGYFTVRNRAQQEAKLAAAEWLDEKGQDAIAEKLGELEIHIAAQKEVATKKLDELYANAAAEITEKQKEVGELHRFFRTTRPSPQPPGGSDAISQLVEVLKHKPEAEYRFDDWNARAYDSYTKKKLALAAEYWLQAAQASNAEGFQAAVSLYNAGVVLAELKRNDEALDVYTEVVLRYGHATEPVIQTHIAMALVNKINVLADLGRNDDALAASDEVISRYHNATELVFRDQVARALLSKGHTLYQLDRYDDAIAAFDEVLSRYGSMPEAGLRQLLASARNGKGYSLLCRAKSRWNNEAARQNDLQMATELCLQATPDMDEPFIALGNQAYATFLLGRQNEARPLLEQALKGGGESLHKMTLDDIAVHPVPPDTEFRAVLEETWEKARVGWAE